MTARKPLRFDKGVRDGIHTALNYVVRTCLESLGDDFEVIAGMQSEELEETVTNLYRALAWIEREQEKRGEA